MNLIYNPIFLDHNTGMHPENRKRLECLGELKSSPIELNESYLSLVHSDPYIEQVRARSLKGLPLDQDTVTSEGSFNAAVAAVSATVEASKTGDFALVRPPGHHAYREHASGFCLFNNVAIATQRLVNQGKRVLIFDFDGHLGDGTFHIFNDMDKVMYWSLHQHPAFPHIESNLIGEGKGTGFTLPVLLPAGSGDDILRMAMDHFLPIAKQYQPDVIAISAGFDAHQYDLLLELRFSVNSYYYLGKLIREEFDQYFATLEGGYNIEHLPDCINSFLAGINGEPYEISEKYTESRVLVRDEFEWNAALLESKLKPYWTF